MTESPNDGSLGDGDDVAFKMDPLKVRSRKEELVPVSDVEFDRFCQQVSSFVLCGDSSVDAPITMEKSHCLTPGQSKDLCSHIEKLEQIKTHEKTDCGRFLQLKAAKETVRGKKVVTFEIRDCIKSKFFLPSELHKQHKSEPSPTPKKKLTKDQKREAKERARKAMEVDVPVAIPQVIADVVIEPVQPKLEPTVLEPKPPKVSEPSSSEPAQAQVLEPLALEPPASEPALEQTGTEEATAEAIPPMDSPALEAPESATPAPETPALEPTATEEVKPPETPAFEPTATEEVKPPMDSPALEPPVSKTPALEPTVTEEAKPPVDSPALETPKSATPALEPTPTEEAKPPMESPALEQTPAEEAKPPTSESQKVLASNPPTICVEQFEVPNLVATKCNAKAVSKRRESIAPFDERLEDVQKQSSEVSGVRKPKIPPASSKSRKQSITPASTKSSDTECTFETVESEEEEE